MKGTWHDVVTLRHWIHMRQHDVDMDALAVCRYLHPLARVALTI